MTATDRYPIKDAWAWMQGLLQRDDCSDARLFAAALAIPYLSNPFQGGYYVTQQFHDRHPAIDWGMPVSTPLYAAHAGQVVLARQDWTGYGWVIAIKDDARGLYSVYGHLNYAAGIGVRVGQWVAEREYIGRSGNTGNSTGPHLHFELRVPPYAYGRNCVNPRPYLRAWDAPPPPTPPPAGNRARCLRNSPIIKKNTGRKVGLHAAGTVLTIGGTNGSWTYVAAQNGQPAGWVKTANLVRES